MMVVELRIIKVLAKTTEGIKSSYPIDVTIMGQNFMYQ